MFTTGPGRVSKFGVSIFGTTRFGVTTSGPVVVQDQKKYTPKKPSFVTKFMVKEIQRRHFLALTQWGQTAILYQRKTHGDLKTVLINDWDSEDPFSKILWIRGELELANVEHPNIERLLVRIGTRTLTQVQDEHLLFGTFSFYCKVDVDETVTLVFSSDFDPGTQNVFVEYETICSCWDRSSRQPSNVKCPTCYGTGYEGGYSRYFNVEGASGYIFIRKSLTPRVMALEEFGYTVRNQEEWWTIPVPRIKDKDILEITSGNEAGSRFHAITVTQRELGAIDGFDVTRQTFSMMELNSTDTVYNAKFL